MLTTLLISGSEFIVEDLNSTKKDAQWIALPYVFSSESTGLTTGVVGIWSGFFQPQMSIVATVFGGEELEVHKFELGSDITKQKARTQGGVLGISGYKPPFSKRIFITALGSYAYYPNQRIYLNGSHNSKQNLKPKETFSLSPLQTQGYNNWAKVDFRYVLPIGNSLGDEIREVLPVIKLKRGIAVNRSNQGNGIPFMSGQTIAGSEFFYTKWSLDKFIKKPNLATNGLRVYVEHDNTDYADNPSRGYNFKLQYSQDFGFGESTQSWNSIEANYSHYFELDNFSWTRQNVVAFTTWSAYSPSWQKGKKLNPNSSNGILDLHQPPMWEGARLGGWNRMRAYDSNRFSDKAAFYVATEYRIIPQLNPMRDQKWNPIAIDWFQAVLFAEAGRVHGSYNQTLLHDLKYDVGFSLRALAAKVPVRFEMAFGEEGSSMWVMIKQPF